VRLLSLLLLLLLGGCVSAELRTRHAHLPLGEVQDLLPGEADLPLCLARLGAPLWVREHGDGAVLAWGWKNESRWGVTVSVPIGKRMSASASYRRSYEGMQGMVLRFDADWVLREVRRGSLGELWAPAQTRARALDVDA